MNYAKEVKTTLFQTIREVSKTPQLYVKNPKKDFTRNRKLSFEEMLKLILLMEGKSIRKELLEYFEFDEDTATTSAFIQQRDKITSSAFEAVFHSFTNTFSEGKLFKGYRLLACDGSNLNTASNPSDPQHHFNYVANIRTFNMIHINALYDILNRVYVDATIEPGYNIDERTALMTMMLRLQDNSPSILIADRGYMSYNQLAFAQENNINYVIRAKESIAKSLLKELDLAFDTDFDYSLDIQFICKKTKAIREQKGCYKYLSQMNFIYYGDQVSYPIKFRVVRVPIGQDSYEYLFTNLPSDEFDMLTLKELYHLRWSIETAFREVKYEIGLVNLHAKKAEYIEQEIFAKLILYNFSSFITMHAAIQKKERKYVYQVNYSVAIFICKWFLKFRGDLNSPPNVEALIQKELLPIRKERSYLRKLHSKSPVSFIYRVA